MILGSPMVHVGQKATLWVLPLFLILFVIHFILLIGSLQFFFVSWDVGELTSEALQLVVLVLP
jgi:hypothetical protein